MSTEAGPLEVHDRPNERDSDVRPVKSAEKEPQVSDGVEGRPGESLQKDDDAAVKGSPVKSIQKDPKVG
jgi:hypothetical protein